MAEIQTVTIGNNTGNTYAGCKDAGLWYEDELNYGGKSFSEIKYTSGINVMLLEFSGLSNIPSNATIISAILHLYGFNPWDDIQLNLRALLVPWTEGTQDGGDRTLDTPYSCSWSYRSGNNLWSSPGGLGNGTDRRTLSAGTININTDLEYHDSTDLTSLVQEWVSGSLTNNGMIITRDTQDGFYYVQIPTKSGTDGQRPYLEVTFSQSSGFVGRGIMRGVGRGIMR